MSASPDRDRLAELRKALTAKIAESDEIIDSIQPADGADLVVTTEQNEAFERNLGDIKSLQHLIGQLEQVVEAKGYLAAPDGNGAATAANAAAALGEQHRVPMSLGARFSASDEFKSLQGGRAGLTMRTPFVIEEFDVAGYGRKDIYSSLPTGTPGDFGSVQRDATIVPPHRRVRIRDLFGGGVATGAAVIEYFQQSGFTNAASVVAERVSSAFGTKPQSSFTYTGQQAVVRTIAHWEAAHRNTLDDEPQLRGIIDGELMYGLQLAEDDQILNGTGTGQDLLGLLHTSGIQTYSQSSGPSTDNGADAIRRAATKAFLSNYEPTGVVVHPNNWEDMELVKSTTGEYLLAVSIALGGEPRLWTIPVVQTPAIAENTALVGAFGLGATLYDRMQASIRIAEQHSTFFVQNAIAILAEERIALATKRPEAFVKVTLT